MKTILPLWTLLILIASEAQALQPAIKQYYEHVTAPGFILTDTNDSTHRLTDYRDRVLIINFWATWCTPCRKEMPSLKLAWERLKKENIQLIGIATMDSNEAVMQYKKANNIKFPLLIDKNGSVADRWRILAVPTAYIIDPNGHIIMRLVGGNDWNNQKLLDSIIALKKTSTN